MMHNILHDFSTPSLLKAMEANVQQAWLRLGRGLGAKVYDEPELHWFISGLPFHLANGIVKTQFSTSTAENAIEERLNQFEAYHMPMTWLISPSTRPTNLGSYLEKRGWLKDSAPGMAIDLHSLDSHDTQRSPLPSLTIKRVSNVEMLKVWLSVMTTGSEIPEEGLALLVDIVNKHGFKLATDVYYYLGMLEGKPVATSLLYTGGGVAGIYDVATLPEFRKQGIGRALTLAPLLEARTLGYRIGTLQSTLMGHNLYRNIGFQEYTSFNAYFSPEP